MTFTISESGGVKLILILFIFYNYFNQIIFESINLLNYPPLLIYTKVHEISAVSAFFMPLLSLIRHYCGHISFSLFFKVF